MDAFERPLQLLRPSYASVSSAKCIEAIWSIVALQSGSFPSPRGAGDSRSSGQSAANTLFVRSFQSSMCASAARFRRRWTLL
jgi:hypothetical protein